MVPARKHDVNAVKSILMDDLLEVITFKRAILKIDIEGHEYEGFQHAEKLFMTIDFPIVFMEWEKIKNHDNRLVPDFLVNFFARHNYKAYSSIDSTVPLHAIYTEWPYDIVWRKQYP